jgi:hypothetical protein
MKDCAGTVSVLLELSRVFSARLLMVLMYLRWNVSYRALVGQFGVSKDAVLPLDGRAVAVTRRAGRHRRRRPAGPHRL